MNTLPRNQKFVMTMNKTPHGKWQPRYDDNENVDDMTNDNNNGGGKESDDANNDECNPHRNHCDQ